MMRVTGGLRKGALFTSSALLTFTLTWMLRLQLFVDPSLVDPKSTTAETFSELMLVSKKEERSWLDPYYCNVTCAIDEPCAYKDEVDFRIIVMTFDRPDSLNKCLQAISVLDTMNKTVSVEIWIDSGDKHKESIDARTYYVASNFSQEWKRGRVCVHKRQRNAYIDNQWIYTWEPKQDSREIGVILEDDVDIAPQALRWLYHVHAQYDHLTDLAGYTLQMENTKFHSGKMSGRPLKGPKNATVFLYRMMGTWGWSPHAGNWRKFQHWYKHKNQTTKPYVPNIFPTGWYKSFEKRGTERAMWEMWHIYFTYIFDYFAIHCNLLHYTGNREVMLSYNRKESGLHFGKGSKTSAKPHLLMRVWKPEYANFPAEPVRYRYNGSIINEKSQNIVSASVDRQS